MSHYARTALTACAVVGLLALTACAGGTEEPDIITQEVIGEDAAGRDDTADSDPSQSVPEECSAAYVLAAAPADIAEIDMMPANWPAPPGEAILCLTSETIDGSMETASYATETPIEDVLAHYETALSGYEMYRADGAENGTGYATLDGVGADVAFQVRETDGGFVLVFGTESGL